MKRILFVGMLLFFSFSSTRALEIGDDAPSINLGVKWVHGEGKDPAEKDGKTIYIVNFWSTRVEGSMAAIGILNQLHKLYNDKNVVILGLARDRPTDFALFMANAPIKYAAGLDIEGNVFRSYVIDRGVPFTFIVGADGKVLWRGQTQQGLMEAMREILTGTYDAKKALEIIHKEDELRKVLMDRNGDINKIDASIDELIKLAPTTARFYAIKASICQGLYEKQEQIIAEARKVFDQWEKGCADSPEGLIMLANMVAFHSAYSMRNPEQAVRAARKAFVLTGGKSPQAIMTLTQVYFELGLVEEALKTLKGGIKEADEEQVKNLEPLVKYYETIIANRKLGVDMPKVEPVFPYNGKAATPIKPAVMDEKKSEVDVAPGTDAPAKKVDVSSPRGGCCGGNVE